MLVDPMPTMVAQVGQPGLMIVIDLNCGWYCAVAMLAHWFEQLSGRPPAEMPLPCGKICAYHPYFDTHDTYAGAIKWGAKPTTVAAWETHLTNNGPTIVSGKLGAADWSAIPAPDGWQMGVGHFILVVGADAAAGTIAYKDPLRGDDVLHYDFADMNPRIAQNVYWTDMGGAMQIFGRINAK